MKPKPILTVVLLAFVVASAGYFIFTEMKKKSAVEVAADSGGDPRAATTDGPANKVVVYYFHSTQRCWTCKTIEAFTAETLRTDFSKQLESGTLEWKPVNVDETANQHFIDDFELAAKTVVLVHVVDGSAKEWKKLDRVWELVRDKPAFIDYVRDSTNHFLADIHG